MPAPGGGGASTSGAGGAAGDLDAAMAELDLEHYDSDEAGAAGPRVNLFGSGKAFYKGAREDPYLKGGTGAAADADSDADDSERDELNLRPSDLLILAARNEDDVSHLEARPRPPAARLVAAKRAPAAAQRPLWRQLLRAGRSRSASACAAAPLVHPGTRTLPHSPPGKLAPSTSGRACGGAHACSALALGPGRRRGRRCGCMRRRTRRARPTCTCTTTSCCRPSR